MNTSSSSFVVAGLALLISTSALAAINNIKDLSDGAQVNVTGVVDSVQNQQEFTLQDSSGNIKIDIASNQSIVLKPGDTVTVTGVVDKHLFSTDVNASSISVDKNLARVIGDAIEGNTSVSLEGATTYKISNLPQEGLVKIAGRVIDVSNAQSFTVKDATGTISVDIQSQEIAAVKPGAEVTVVGTVDNGMFGKGINASKVLVTGDTASIE